MRHYWRIHQYFNNEKSALSELAEMMKQKRYDHVITEGATNIIDSSLNRSVQNKTTLSGRALNEHLTKRRRYTSLQRRIGPQIPDHLEEGRKSIGSGEVPQKGTVGCIWVHRKMYCFRLEQWSSRWLIGLTVEQDSRPTV